MRGVTQPTGPDLALVQTYLADHRQAIIEVLGERLGSRFVAYAGGAYREHPLITLASIRPMLRPLRNHYLARRRLLWQHGSFRAGVGPSVLIVDYNPHVLSTWGVLLVRRALGRRTLLWGRPWPDAGPRSRMARGRRLMRGLASAVVVYEDAEARALAAELPRGRIFVAPIALVRERGIAPATDDTMPTDFVFVGPLVPARDPLRLLDAFVRARGRLPDGARLVFVGDGPLRASLEAAAVPLGPAVAVLGRVRDERVPRDLYARSIASVHPGEVGLSATQSLGFGVPLVFSRDRRLSPTTRGAEVGWNAMVFSTADPHGLEDAMVAMAAERESWVGRRPAISARCRVDASAEAGADAILRACGFMA